MFPYASFRSYFLLIQMVCRFRNNKNTFCPIQLYLAKMYDPETVSEIAMTSWNIRGPTIDGHASTTHWFHLVHTHNKSLQQRLALDDHC